MGEYIRNLLRVQKSKKIFSLLFVILDKSCIISLVFVNDHAWFQVSLILRSNVTLKILPPIESCGECALAEVQIVSQSVSLFVLYRNERHAALCPKNVVEHQ